MVMESKISDYSLQITYYEGGIKREELQIRYYGLQITGYYLMITGFITDIYG